VEAPERLVDPVTDNVPDPVLLLAQQLAALQTHVEGLAGLAGQVADLDTRTRDLVEVPTRLDQIGEQIEQLAASVEQLADETEKPRVAPWLWIDLTPEEAGERLGQLAGWYQQVLVVRYQRTLPACWPAHPPAVEILSVLYAGWLAAFTPPGKGRTAGALEWTDRYLPSLHRQADALLKTCLRGHVPAGPTPVDVDLDQIHAATRSHPHGPTTRPTPADQEPASWPRPAGGFGGR
jgi:hypothetical protein